MSFQELMSRIHGVMSTPAFSLGETEVTVGTLFWVSLLIAVTIVVAGLTSRAILGAFERRGTVDLDAVRPYARVAKATILLIGLGTALRTLGFDLTAIFAAGGLFAIAIGFAMKNIAENFVSGLILRLEKSIKRGDVLRVEGQVVTVKDIGIRYTLALNRDNEDLLLPNSVLVQSTVTNRTLRDPLFRLRASVGVTYSSNMKLVRETLKRAADEIPWRAKEFDPVVVLRQFGSSSVDFEVSVWTEDPWRIGRQYSDLNEAIWWSLKDSGIVIAFPQLDVHFDEPVLDSLTELRRGG